MSGDFLRLVKVFHGVDDLAFLPVEPNDEGLHHDGSNYLKE